MQFIYPQSGSTVSLPKQLDGARASLTIRMAHNDPQATIFWHLDNEYLGCTKDFHEVALTLQAGKYIVTSVDNQGYTLTTEFVVK